jgi:hypothetical protein
MLAHSPKVGETGQQQDYLSTQGDLLLAITPRYRSEAEGEGLQGPFFICRYVDGSVRRWIDLYRFMIY